MFYDELINKILNWQYKYIHISPDRIGEVLILILINISFQT